jgi:hypothetical protein
LFGGCHGFRVLPVAQVMPRPAIAVAQGMHHPIQRGHADLHAPLAHQQCLQIAQRPDRHRETVGVGILAERVAQEGARGRIQFRRSSAPCLVGQARTPCHHEAVLPGTYPVGSRPKEPRHLRQRMALLDEQHSVRAPPHPRVRVRLDQMPQLLHALFGSANLLLNHDALLADGVSPLRSPLATPQLMPIRLAWSPDGRLLASAAKDGAVRVESVEDE